MIEYLIGLAQEGETLLFVQQKPVMRNGEPQYHADGSPKYTYPAFRPGSKPLKGATYVIQSRLRNVGFQSARP